MSNRKDTIIKAIKDYETGITNISEKALKEKIDKLNLSPFVFFRGAPVLFYHDLFSNNLSFNSKDNQYNNSTLSNCWIDADLHINNFGYLKNKDREVQFDLNDFDEAYIGSYWFDIKRLCSSIAIYSSERGFDESDLFREFFESFYKKLKKFINGEDDAEGYAVTKKNAEGFIQEKIQSLEERKRIDILKKFTVLDTPNQFLSNEELIFLTENTKREISTLFEEVYVPKLLSQTDRYSEKQMKVLDICEKRGSGTSSIGLVRYFVLVQGKEDGFENNMIIELKKARASVVGLFLPKTTSFANEGERVIRSAHILGSNLSPFVQYIQKGDLTFITREISSGKSSVELSDLNKKDFILLAKSSAKLYAKALYKSVVYQNRDPKECFADILDNYSNFCEYVVDFSSNYRDITFKDFELLFKE